MLDDALMDLAARHGLDSEVVAELVALLDPDPERSSDPTPHLLRRIGTGGTAEVWEAEDPDLERAVALKVLRSDLANRPGMRERFLREARATAGLVHPGIVPIHGLGTLSDGRPYFTMAVVRGQTLDALFQEPPTAPGEMRRRLSLVQRAVDAVAYAHDRGVLHRDLKPANIMAGRFGTVFVLDWGLVRASGSSAPTSTPLPVGDAHTVGVSGTPGYMSPEQLAGGTLSPASDVYALGVVLREIIGADGPDPLVAIADRATAAVPEDRFRDAGELADALGRWIDGEIQREQALEQVVAASEMAQEEDALREAATKAREEARAALKTLPRWAPAEQLAPFWRQVDEADERLADADTLRQQRLVSLHGALTLDPTCPEALDALAEHWRARHEAAETAQDRSAVREAEAQLAHYDRGVHARYLAGRGTIELDSSPSGVNATLYRFEEVDRVLVPVDPRELGPTPVRIPDVPMGSYLVELDTEPPVRVPIWIPRNHEWRQPPVSLLRPDALGPDDCYVPVGPFFRGSHVSPDRYALPGHFDALPARVMRRYPVTQRDYIAFLDALVDQGREADALRCAPRVRQGPHEPGALCYARDEAGHFHLTPDADGDVWDPDYPVFLVDRHGAQAYAAWVAERTGRPWRLPTGPEWEKAARGVDGRTYPWGNRFSPSFACVRTSHPGRPLPARVHEYPTDCSVYGVRGMAGNVREWCGDSFYLPATSPPTEAGDQAMVRGGCWFLPAVGAHLAARYGLDPDLRGDTIGFRLIRSLTDDDVRLDLPLPKRQ